AASKYITYKIMRNILRILYNPTQVFTHLDNLYEENLNTNSNLIASVFGGLVGVYSIIAEFENIQEIVRGWPLVIASIAGILISSVLCVLFYNYVLTYILYFVGKLMGSKGLVADTRTAIVYSIIPISFIMILAVVLILIPDTLIDIIAQYWILRISTHLIWAWTMVILIIGLRILNKYGTLKAVVNILPIPLIGLIIFLIKYL
ncbi:YIP1 family protein, partial [Labilibacter marinus]|uniref:YIP1 family protein n=1 Tax=Labilibacter marinus TaxID=1477105 RepID=UPI001E5C487A